MKTVVSLSALQPSQYRQYAKGWKPDQTLLEIFEKQSHKRGKKAYRIYFDYATDRNMRISDHHVPPAIAAYLHEQHLQLLDYVAGTVKDKHDRVLRLGKVLSKQAQLKKLFDNDANRRQIVTASKGNKLVCLSMHPYDIAGMSTDRGWTSCMNLVDGGNRKYVKQDVKANTLIAYLVNPDDKNVNSPIMRVLLKKFLNGNGSAYRYVAEVAYPDASDRLFVTKVQDWVDEHINTITDKSTSPSVLVRKKGLYDDGGGSFTMSGLAELADLGFHKLEGALDKIFLRKQSAFGKRGQRVASMRVDEPTAEKLFKIAPDAIRYKHIASLVPRSYEFWLKSIETLSDKNKRVKEAFETFKKYNARDKQIAYDIMGSLAAKGDTKALATANESIPVEEFLKTGEVNFVLERMMRKAGGAVRAYRLCAELAKFGDKPDITFWKCLAGVYTKYSKEEAFDDVDSSMVYMFKSYETVSKIGGEYLTLDSLKKAKKELPPLFYSAWQFLLNPGAKSILELSYDDLDAHSYDDTRDAFFSVKDYFEEEYKPKPKFMLLSREVRGDTPMFICFDKNVNVTKLKEEMKAKFVRQEFSKVFMIPLGRMSPDKKDILYTYKGDDWSVVEDVDSYDCRAEISEDPTTNVPMATIYGDEDDVDYVIEVIQDRINMPDGI